MTLFGTPINHRTNIECNYLHPTGTPFTRFRPKPFRATSGKRPRRTRRKLERVCAQCTSTSSACVCVFSRVVCVRVRVSMCVCVCVYLCVCLSISAAIISMCDSHEYRACQTLCVVSMGLCTELQNTPPVSVARGDLILWYCPLFLQAIDISGPVDPYRRRAYAAAFILFFFFFLYTYTKRLSLKTRDGTGERWRMGETSEKRFAVRSPAKFVSRRKSRAGRLGRTRSSRPSHGGLNLGGKKSHFKVFNVWNLIAKV